MISDESHFLIIFKYLKISQKSFSKNLFRSAARAGGTSSLNPSPQSTKVNSKSGFLCYTSARG